MKSDIFDKNNKIVKVGDTLSFPWIDPMGGVDKDVDFQAEVVFEYGCMGYFRGTSFHPLMNWMKKEVGSYIPNEGNKVIYTNKYIFWKTPTQ